MAFRRSFNPALINSANVKALRDQSSARIDDGTSKSNEVARKDLAYWIPKKSSVLFRVGFFRYSSEKDIYCLRTRFYFAS